MSLSHRLEQILDFLLLADRFKLVERQIHLTGGRRKENDAEHCWHMALYALLLHEEIGLKVDLARTLALITVHDLVEIYAGDTDAFDVDGQQDKDAREAAAADKLFGKLPEDLCARLHQWWREFEEGASPEARFARALDRLQALGQGVLSDGKAWQEGGVSREQVLERMREAMEADQTIRALVDTLYDRADRDQIWSAGHQR